MSVKTPGSAYWWNRETTEESITSALTQLSARYPALKTQKRAKGVELVFKKGAAGLCSATKDGNKCIVTYSRPNMAVRMVGNILADAIPKKADSHIQNRAPGPPVELAIATMPFFCCTLFFSFSTGISPILI